MDALDLYGQTWHEDDELHQAEGMLCVRLGLSIGEAVRAIRIHSDRTGTPLGKVATGIIEGGVVVTAEATERP